MTVRDVQSLLADDEAVLVINLSTISCIWVITKNTADWKWLGITDAQVREKVDILLSMLSVSNPRPFDPKVSFDLYTSILASSSEQIALKPRLTVIADGVLAGIPLQLLVTSDPTSKPLSDVQWLIRSHAITLLPSLASLKALRTRSGSQAPKPLVGFADPILNRESA